MLSGGIRSSLAHTQSDGAVFTFPERALNPRRLHPALVSPHDSWIQIAQLREKKRDAISLVGFLLISAMLER